MKAKLQSVQPGSADVMHNGHYIGCVAHSASARAWWAYDRTGKRLSQWPNPTRGEAIREVARAANAPF
jgi:hypothetical protein